MLIKQNYLEYKFEPIAIENPGVFSSTTLNFISELGRRICVPYVRETATRAPDTRLSSLVTVRNAARAAGQGNVHNRRGGNVIVVLFNLAGGWLLVTRHCIEQGSVRGNGPSSYPCQQRSHRPQTPPPGAATGAVTLSTRHFLVAAYPWTLRASMMS